jgi:aconitate hydratase
MQDFTGVPAVVDLAAMRDAMKPRRRPPEDQPAGARRSRHRPLGHGRRLRHAAASPSTSKLEYERNGERYTS